MKKTFYVFILLTLFTAACSVKEMANTPIKQTEIFLNKYQTLDQNVLDDLNRVVAKETQFNTEQRERYKDIMKNHYRNLVYTIKDEEINGDRAVVTVEIEVIDYSTHLRESEIYLAENPDEFQNEFGEYDIIKYSDYRLKRLKEAKDKVKYTLDINLTKDDDNWNVEQISTIDEEKIHGIYVY